MSPKKSFTVDGINCRLYFIDNTYKIVGVDPNSDRYFITEVSNPTETDLINLIQNKIKNPAKGFWKT